VITQTSRIVSVGPVLVPAQIADPICPGT